MPIDHVPVIGIGASAGGLDALKALLSAMPSDSNAAFMVITHRDPEGVSLLPEILRKYTGMPVVEATDGMMIEENHVYVSPPSHYLNILDGALVFKDVIHHGVALPIDSFFRSLAERRQQNAIGIVLSGNGSDGTLGLHEIKGAGGFTIAQDPMTAEYTDMPTNAIAAGVVDCVLAPEKIPEGLIANLKGKADGAWEDNTPHGHLLEEILLLIRERTGNDFLFYKSSTLQRRVDRRMKVHQLANYKEYLRYLKDNSHETGLLFKELLIGVTCFFRDREAFKILENDVLPQLLKKKLPGGTLRVWVPGCSTGEEAYSIAILIQEYIERTKAQLNVQIFATDLDESAICRARTGVYSDGIALDISRERLHKYFIRDDDHYRVKKNLRETVIFATHNLIHDQPFTKLNLISCRNLMIYLNSAPQKKIIPMFHYALAPRGVLFLGTAEHVGNFKDLFDSVSARWKIFRRRDAPLSLHNPMSFMDSQKVKDKKMKKKKSETKEIPVDAQSAKQNPQSAVEERETDNDDLRSSNEDLQSTNEELQSANEELETAKEEMQSLNEELHTVNAELENKLNELSSANDDMKNLLNSTGIATLFLDNDLNIKRFTIQTKKIINLIHTDVGRPISDIAIRLDYSDMVNDANEVLQTLKFKEMEVRASDWSWYLMRIMPYRTAENVIDGLVITFVDITKSKKSEILLAANSMILKMMCIDEAPLIDTLDAVLRTIEKHAAGIRCAVSLLANDNRHLRHGSSPSLPKEFTEKLDGIEINDNSPQPCAAAIFRDEQVVVSDLSQVASSEFSKLALQNNIKACWSQPIHSMQGKVIGSFTIYYQQVRQPSAPEEELINQTVSLMGLAISRQSLKR